MANILRISPLVLILILRFHWATSRGISLVGSQDVFHSARSGLLAEEEEQAATKEDEDMVVYMPISPVTESPVSSSGNKLKLSSEADGQKDTFDQDHLVVLFPDEKFPLEDLERIAEAELEKFSAQEAKISPSLEDRESDSSDKIQFHGTADVPNAPLSISIPQKPLPQTPSESEDSEKGIFDYVQQGIQQGLQTFTNSWPQITLSHSINSPTNPGPSSLSAEVMFPHIQTPVNSVPPSTLKDPGTNFTAEISQAEDSKNSATNEEEYGKNVNPAPVTESNARGTEASSLPTNVRNLSSELQAENLSAPVQEERMIFVSSENAKNDSSISLRGADKNLVELNPGDLTESLVEAELPYNAISVGRADDPLTIPTPEEVLTSGSLWNVLHATLPLHLGQSPEKQPPEDEERMLPEPRNTSTSSQEPVQNPGEPEKGILEDVQQGIHQGLTTIANSWPQITFNNPFNPRPPNQGHGPTFTGGLTSMFPHLIDLANLIVPPGQKDSVGNSTAVNEKVKVNETLPVQTEGESQKEDPATSANIIIAPEPSLEEMKNPPYPVHNVEQVQPLKEVEDKAETPEKVEHPNAHVTRENAGSEIDHPEKTLACSEKEKQKNDGEQVLEAPVDPVDEIAKEFAPANIESFVAPLLSRLEESGSNFTEENFSIPVTSLQNLTLSDFNFTAVNSSEKFAEEMAVLLSAIETEHQLIGGAKLGSLLSGGPAGANGAGGLLSVLQQGGTLSGPFGPQLGSAGSGGVVPPNMAAGINAYNQGFSNLVNTILGNKPGSGGLPSSSSYSATPGGGSAGSSSGGSGESQAGIPGGGSSSGSAGASNPGGGRPLSGHSGGGGGGAGNVQCIATGRLCQTIFATQPCCSGQPCTPFSTSLLNSVFLGNLGTCQ